MVEEAAQDWRVFECAAGEDARAQLLKGRRPAAVRQLEHGRLGTRPHGLANAPPQLGDVEGKPGFGGGHGVGAAGRPKCAE
jgi:hypothetical protein